MADSHQRVNRTFAQEKNMVTIDPDKLVTGIPNLKRTEPSTAGQDGTFKAVLKETVGETEDSHAAADMSAAVSAIRPAQFSAQPSPTRAMIVDQVEALIDTMATYQQKLVEEGATMKTIAPLVEKMERQTKQLGTIANAAQEQGALKPILEQSLAVSSMEIARFKNGFYIG